MTDEPTWDLYRSFLAVMREGSLSAAARALGMTQPSIGRHIQQLEAQLDTPLFSRSQQGLLPTAMAQELLPHAQAMASASAALKRAASAREQVLEGSVRLSCSEVVGVEVLPPMLALFREQHPGVVIELSLTDRTEDLLRRDADLAVRMATPTQAALVARKIGRIGLGLYAHRDYLAAHGKPRTLEQLSQHSLIGYDQETAYIRKMRPKSLPYRREDFSLRCDSDLAVIAAIRAGYGIGFCQQGIALREGLQPVLPSKITLGMDTWLVMHEDLRRSARVRALFDHLATTLAQYATASSPAAIRS